MKLLWIATFGIVLVWSAIAPHDYFTWFLEVAPALLGFVVVAATYRRFRLTTLAYVLILIHCIILMVGGHYTYAEVPLFDGIKDIWELERNNYDKVGHLAQGFIPAVIAREILIRTKAVRRGSWLNLFVVSICLSVSASYELVEWGVALVTGTSAKAFLGMQGYVWDTQSDMLFALIGAVLALMLLSSIHDRQIEGLTGREWVKNSMTERTQ